MASLPKPAPVSRFLNADELLAIRGTPEFELELGRQMDVIAEHDRATGNANRFEVDWDSIKGWE